MNPALEAAVDALLEELTKQEAEVRETKRTVNNLLRRMGKEPRFSDTEEQSASHHKLSIRPDQFYGRPLATVTREILDLRKQATPAEELIRVLISGGFDFDALGWREGDRLRSFTITLAKNNKAFHRLPNGMFGLPEWYPEALKRKQQRQSEKNAADQVSEPEEPEDLPNDADV